MVIDEPQALREDRLADGRDAAAELGPFVAAQARALRERL
jgi:hypothetical protein